MSTGFSACPVPAPNNCAARSSNWVFHWLHWLPAPKVSGRRVPPSLYGGVVCSATTPKPLLSTAVLVMSPEGTER